MKFEVGTAYFHRPTESRVVYVGPSADKEYAVFEGPYGDYDADVWANLEVIREPRRFWLLYRSNTDHGVVHDGVYCTQTQAYAVAQGRGCEVIPVMEILPDEDTSI